MKVSRAKGFTLIELLVVIAIIAILAAILFPVFVKAKVAAQRIACVSNLRQMNAAMRMYQQDYNGEYPSTSVYNGDPVWHHSLWIRMLLDHYAPSRKFFACPGAAKNWEVGNGVKSGFGMNEYIFYRDQGAQKDSGIPNPKHTLLVADAYKCSLVNDWTDSDDPNPNDPLPSGFRRVKYADAGTGGVLQQVRHGGPDVLFCDGHLLRLRPEQIMFSGSWGKSTSRQYPIVYPKAKLPL